MIRSVRFSWLIACAALGCDGPTKKDPPPFDAGFHLDSGGFDAGDPASCTAHTPTDPGVVLGSGEVEFVELVDGDEVPFYRGPQDGYHFYGGVKERNLDTSDAAIVAFAAFEGDEQINDGLGVYARPASWTPAGDGWRATFGYYVVMNIEGPKDVDGHTVCVLVRVSDASDVVYTDERTIRLRYEGDM